MEALTWFIIGACAMLAAVVIGAIIAAVIRLGNSPPSDCHYVD